PNPWSKTISTGTRESEHPRIAANGSWPAVSSARRRGVIMDSELRLFSTNRRLPSRRRCRASRAGIIELLFLNETDIVAGFPTGGQQKKITGGVSVRWALARLQAREDVK